MEEIKIKLRIVGLYFNKTVAIENKKGLNVKDVMDKYIHENPLSVPGGLEYTRATAYTVPELVITTIKHNFSGDFDFEGDNDEAGTADGPSLGDVKRESGIYTLTEDLEDHFPKDEKGKGRAGLAWQYYVVAPSDEVGKGIVKSKTPVGRKFKRFDDATPDYTLEDGDTIIWRLVAIARHPDEAVKYDKVATAY